jgi:hypothetical protein
MSIPVECRIGPDFDGCPVLTDWRCGKVAFVAAAAKCHPSLKRTAS